MLPVLLAILAVPMLYPQEVAGQADTPPSRKVIVLGFDGLDYDLTRELMNEGRLPNFSRLEEMGQFAPLGTAVPPQSPVAWSNFITGNDACSHGIFDFIHRDPSTMIPYLSTSRTEESEKTVKIGKWQIPLSGGKIELLRRGKAFWEYLDAHDIKATIMRIPANFPPSGRATRELSGMGTPDLRGTYGTFSFFTEDDFLWAGKTLSGGVVYPAEVTSENVVRGVLHGPPNPFLVEEKRVEAPFEVYLDPEEAVVKIVLGDEERVLEEGEWSDWVPLSFKLIPTQTLRGMVRFYLREVRPTFQLYVTPVNMDPLHPAMPISTPPSFAAELAKATGRYYTQGMPEDTKALSEGILTRAEFLEQAKIAGDEILDQYHYVLDQFEEGLLFYYVGTVDLVCHMTWRSMDPDHPAYDAEKDAPFADVIPSWYERLDGVIGYTLERIDDETTLIVMSDHGFTTWRRSFHLNSWLAENGYLALRNPDIRDDPGFLLNVDWERTVAYGLGLNGLYLNLQGRERDGIVPLADRDRLLDEISKKLLAVVDTATGQPAITKVYKGDEYFRDCRSLEIGPDLLVGYAKGTRCSFESAQGEISKTIFADNTDEWSGDHCMDHEAVPGILLSNRPLKRPAKDLMQMGDTILAELGIDETMRVASDEAAPEH
jgi:predicted AlkP superfamily phosphohydrolase/phosphomutase